MIVVCFEDALVDRLHPVAWTRPAYGITCGGYRLIDWINRINGSKYGAVRPHLRQIQTLDYGLEDFTSGAVEADEDEGALLINARLTPSVENFQTLRDFAGDRRTRAMVDSADGAVLVGRLSPGDWQQIVARSSADTAADVSSGSPLRHCLKTVSQHPVSDPAVRVIRFPHDVVAHHIEQMQSSLADRINHGRYQEVREGVFVGQGVVLSEMAVTDTTAGAIVLDDHASVGPFSFLSGPLMVGAGSRIIEHASIKDAVVIGHTAKVGGEVEASIIEPYTNKQHHGFLGHSYLGSWINLGAGTCNSDLKNTYGKINMTSGEERIATEMQFLGCFIGDYTKSAINTSIFTGKTIGVCSMLYGFVTTNVPSFTNAGDAHGRPSELPAEVMVKTQQRMFARRKIQQRPCDQQLLADLYDLTAGQRGLP